MGDQIATVKQAPQPASLSGLITLTVLSILLWHAPFIGWVLGPIRIFVTILHELSHALVCVATGGNVAGLTIVSDNVGHGGTTMCSGGNPFLYIQAGYLGTAFWGCLFIILGRFPGMSKAVLSFMGILIIVSTLVFMPGTFWNGGDWLQGFASMGWAVAIGAALVWCGFKLKSGLAHSVLLFLAVNTALNAVTNLTHLAQLAVGGDATQNDDTIMASMTHIPAWFWSISWAAIAIAMLGGTLWLVYGSPFKRTKQVH